jgi:pimeloyl-ACP methyl ester carboxylesterase
VRTEFRLSTGTTAALDNQATSGAVVLLVPGYTGSKEDFMPLLRPLADAGYRAVAIDQRGQYESSWATQPSGYVIDTLASDICELSTELAESDAVVHLVGHSFGGLVTRAAVIAKPALFDSYTIMGSGPGSLPGQRRTELEAMEPVLAQYGMTVLWDQIALRSQADPKWVASPPALKQFLRTRFLRNDPVGLQVMGNELRSVADRTEELAATGVPMLVLHGVDDDAWPPAVQREMAERLDVSYRVIADAAHSPAVENPAGTMDTLLDFWTALPRRR